MYTSIEITLLPVHSQNKWQGWEIHFAFLSLRNFIHGCKLSRCISHYSFSVIHFHFTAYIRISFFSNQKFTLHEPVGFPPCSPYLRVLH